MDREARRQRVLQQKQLSRAREIEEFQSHFELRDSIVARGARVQGVTYQIPPLGGVSEIPYSTGDASLLPIYQYTMRETSDNGIRNEAYRIADNNSVLAITQYRNEFNFYNDGIGAFSNLPVDEAYAEGRGTNVKYEDVSIFLNIDDEFLPPRKIDVIMYNRYLPQDPVLLNIASAYDAVITDLGFGSELYAAVPGLIRYVLEVGSTEYAQQTFRPTTQAVTQSLQASTRLNQRLQQIQDTRRRLLGHE